MRANRSIAVVALMTMPAGTFAQEPAAGFANPRNEVVDLSAQWETIPTADLGGGGRRRRGLVIPVAALTAPSSPPVAQVSTPAPWQAVEAWPSGEQMVITLKTGERIEGAFKHSNAEDLVLTSRTGSERRILKADIRQVNGEREDTSVDGLLLGAAIGAGFGVLLGYGRRTFECRAACSIAIGVTLFTPTGAFVGWLRDRRRTQTEVLYDAP
jgi:hypothetical protein